MKFKCKFLDYLICGNFVSICIQISGEVIPQVSTKPQTNKQTNKSTFHSCSAIFSCPWICFCQVLANVWRKKNPQCHLHQFDKNSFFMIIVWVRVVENHIGPVSRPDENLSGPLKQFLLEYVASQSCRNLSVLSVGRMKICLSQEFPLKHWSKWPAEKMW